MARPTSGAAGRVLRPGCRRACLRSRPGRSCSCADPHAVPQVCTGGLRLLSGTSVLQEVSVEALAGLVPALGPPGSPSSLFVSSAAVADPFVALQLSDDRALLLCANHETGAPQSPVQDSAPPCWLPRQPLRQQRSRGGLLCGAAAVRGPRPAAVRLPRDRCAMVSCSRRRDARLHTSVAVLTAPHCPPTRMVGHARA